MATSPLPPTTMEKLYALYLNGEVGFVGVVGDNDKILDRAGVITVNLDVDTSALMEALGQEPSIINSFDAKEQEILIQTHLRLLQHHKPNIKKDFIKTLVFLNGKDRLRINENDPEWLAVSRIFEAIGIFSLPVDFSVNGLKSLSEVVKNNNVFDTAEARELAVKIISGSIRRTSSTAASIPTKALELYELFETGQSTVTEALNKKDEKVKNGEKFLLSSRTDAYDQLKILRNNGLVKKLRDDRYEVNAKEKLPDVSRFPELVLDDDADENSKTEKEKNKAEIKPKPETPKPRNSGEGDKTTVKTGMTPPTPETPKPQSNEEIKTAQVETGTPTIPEAEKNANGAQQPNDSLNDIYNMLVNQKQTPWT